MKMLTDTLTGIPKCTQKRKLVLEWPRTRVSTFSSSLPKIFILKKRFIAQSWTAELLWVQQEPKDSQKATAAPSGSKGQLLKSPWEKETFAHNQEELILQKLNTPSSQSEMDADSMGKTNVVGPWPYTWAFYMLLQVQGTCFHG